MKGCEHFELGPAAAPRRFQFRPECRVLARLDLSRVLAGITPLGSPILGRAHPGPDPDHSSIAAAYTDAVARAADSKRQTSGCSPGFLLLLVREALHRFVLAEDPCRLAGC